MNEVVLYLGKESYEFEEFKEYYGYCLGNAIGISMLMNTTNKKRYEEFLKRGESADPPAKVLPENIREYIETLNPEQLNILEQTKLEYMDFKGVQAFMQGNPNFTWKYLEQFHPSYANKVRGIGGGVIKLEFIVKAAKMSGYGEKKLRNTFGLPPENEIKEDTAEKGSKNEDQNAPL